MTTSCQVTGMNKEMWAKFRQQCIQEGLSANRKVKMLIEAEVARHHNAEDLIGPRGTEKEQGNG